MNSIQIIFIAATGTSLLLLGLNALGKALAWEQLEEEDRKTVRDQLFSQHNIELATYFLLSVVVIFFMILVPILLSFSKLLFWSWISLFFMILCPILAAILTWLRHYRFSLVAMGVGFLIPSLIWGNLLTLRWPYAPLLQVPLLALASIYLSFKVRHPATKFGFRFLFITLVAWSLYLLDPILIQAY